jgi:hypothetical protein
MSAEKLAELLDAWRSRPSHKHEAKLRSDDDLL